MELVEILSLLERYAIGLCHWQNSTGHEFILHLHLSYEFILHNLTGKRNTVSFMKAIQLNLSNTLQNI